MMWWWDDGGNAMISTAVGRILSADLTAIYDAAISETRWQNALDECARCIGADGAMLYEFSSLNSVDFELEKTNSMFLRIAGELEEYNRLVAEGRGSDLDKQGLGANHAAKKFSVTFDEDIWDIDDQFYARPEVEIGVRLGLVRRVLVNLSDDPNTFSGLIYLFGEDSRSSIPTWTKEVANFFAPHMAKAVELNRLTSRLNQRYNAVLSVLNKVDTGVFILLENGDVILQNNAADDLVAEQDGLFLNRDGRIRCATSADTQKFAKVVRRVGATASGTNDFAGTSFLIERKSGKDPLLSVIAPLRDADMELEAGLAGALVTIVDPTRQMQVETKSLGEAYGFTKAEERLLPLLLDGLSYREIAETLGVGPETIKTQISSVMAKSGCKNRTALLWKIFQFHPPII